MQNFWSCLKIFGWSLELFRNLRNGFGDIWKCSQNDYLQLPLEGIEGTLTALKTQCTSHDCLQTLEISVSIFTGVFTTSHLCCTFCGNVILKVAPYSFTIAGALMMKVQVICTHSKEKISVFRLL